MSERQIMRLAIIAVLAVVGYTLLTGGSLGGASIRNMGGVPRGGTANIGGRGGM